MRKVLLLIFFIFIVIIVNNENVLAQNSPVISYTTPQVYTAGSVIAPLVPTNTGGAVYPANYSVPVNFAPYTTPFSIAIDGANNVYTTDNSTGNLTKFNSAGTALFTVNTGSIQASEVAVDGLGNIYVSQFTTSSFLKYNAAGTLLATITGFTDPYGIAFDASNNAFVADYFTGDIFEIAAGTTTASVYLTGFTKPYGIIIDASGNMYVSEQGPGDIIKVAAGTLTRTTFASGFNGPRHLNKDLFGNIYVADYGNNAIKRISPAGVITSVLSAGLSSPRQAAFDSSGDLFVANYGTNTLLKALATAYSINAPLPAGLNFDTSTGQVSGTPVAATAATTFTITAYNTGGTSNTPLTITVGAIKAAQQPTTVNTLTSGAVTTTTATLNGFSNYTGSPTLVSFTYGTNPNLINGTTVIATTNSSINAVNNNNSTLALTGLTPLTTYYYRVTATNASGTTTGSILSFVTLPLSNASLSNLSISSGTLSPVFASGTGSYTASVSNATNSVTITPATADPNATITVNGTTLAGGSPSAQVALNVGNNTITTVVTAQDGTTTQSYTITVTRAASSNASLSNLSISSGTLSPVFAGGTGSYTASVSNATNSVTITPATADPNATIRVNGTTLAGGNTSAPIALNVGNNTITTAVTAQDGITTQSYTITVTRAASSNASLSNLSISSGTLSPVFASGTGSYTASVSNATNSVTITPATADPNATITVNGTTLAGGNTSAPIALNVGNNTITTAVTAQDGITTQSYTITVTRAASSNASLSNLSISSGTLSPVFASGTGSYTASVSNATNSVTITPATTDPNATLTVNGTILASGNTSAPIALNIGNNTITAVVTAQDGITTQSYTITVTRSASQNASLSNLSISSGTLSPVFASGTGSYTASVSNTTNSVTITPATADPNATITVNGTILASGNTSAQVALNIGNNTITTAVTAQDGITTQSYTITVTRSASQNASLSNLSISSGTLSPVFASGTGSYTASVSNATNSVTITPATTDPNATLTVNGTILASGNTSAPIALNIGNNTITAVVTAQDGITTQSYTITVTRAASSNASLSNLSISSGTLSPVFASGTGSYTASVTNTTNSVTITPATADPNATITVNGNSVSSGSQSGAIILNNGPTTIVTVVTAADGITRSSYSITINRIVSNNAALSLLTLNPGSSLLLTAGTSNVNYITSVNPGTTSVNVIPTAQDAGATIKVNGNSVISGSPSGAIMLNNGPTTIVTVVTAADGITTRSYSITINRTGSNNAALSLLALNPGSSLLLTAGISNVNYITSVNPGTTSVNVIPTAQDAGATIKVNGNSVISGSPSGAIMLNNGPTTIVTVVTAADGITTRSYSITINRTGSNNAALSSLALNPGSSLLLTAGTTNVNYVTSVSPGTTSVNVIPTAQDAGATITVNGNSVISGSPSGAIMLNNGPTTIVTVVTAADGITTRSYSITINRTGSNNATLNLLALNPYSKLVLVSATSGNVNYTTLVNNPVASVTVTPTTSDPNATVTVNGTKVLSGAASPAIALNVGNNIITTIVTAQTGTTITYTIAITRALSSNANLSNLAISNGTLSPVFASGTNAYTDTVSNATASVTIIPITSDPNATLTVNGTTLASGTTSAPIALNVGNNTITNVVTAQDGITTQSYTVVVTRAASSNASLSNLAISNGTLSPVFASGTNAYTDTVSNATASVTIIPITSDPNATLTVNGTTLASGTTSAPIALNVGNNTITNVVTAQDGITTQSYTVIVTRAASSNASLSNLAISNGTLSPVFASGTNAYTDTVSNATASVTIIPITSDPNATLTVNGTTLASGTTSTPIALNVGNNTITNVVTAQDGITTQSYTVIVTRAASSNANLSNLVISNGTLSPVFASGTNAYTDTVSNATASVTITPITSDPNATLTVNGTTLASGTTSTPIALNVGNNTITNVVTAQDGITTQSYTVIVTRAASSNANLSNLAISNGTLSPVFASGTNAYTDTVSSTTASVTITPITSDPNASLTVNGTTLASGTTSASIALNTANNTITTVVTAQDGITTQSYTIIVNRQPNVSLASLTTSIGTLAPTFDPATSNYNILVNNATFTIAVTPVAADGNATLTVNGTPIANGAMSAPISLSVGNNTITTVVTSPDGSTTQTYTLTVMRQALSSNANLVNLSLSSGNLNPAFATGTNSYSTNVTNDVTDIMVTPTTSDSTATVTVNGMPVASGSASASQALYVGDNTITTEVTAQDGETRDTYTVTVTRAPSSNANLSSLAISNGTLNPVFAAATTSYTTSVGNAISSITLTPIISDPNATVTINGTILSSGVTSAPINLNVGIDTITTVVTAQDGTTTQSYTVAITRAPSSNANLANIALSNGSLTPAFATGTTSYTASVSYSTTSLTITPTVSDSTATVTVNGIPVASGSASVSQPLIVGDNTLTIAVTAQDGVTIDTYTVTVTRATNSLDISLLLLSSHTPLTLESGNGDVNYTTTVGNSVGSLTITPTATNANVTLKVNGSPVISGSASKLITLNEGPTTISLLVTSKDGANSKNYKLTVKRPILLTNANLSGLKISSGTLSPAFDPAIFNYAVAVDSAISTFAIRPVISDTNATLTVNNIILTRSAASAPIALNEGNNTISTVVTAADGKTTQSYTITVNKQKSVVLANTGMQDAASDKIIVHQAVSPNGDGINDFLLIEGIENYPGNKVSIINRNGATIYSVNEYNNSSKAFDGHSNIDGRLQQPGTYFYIIDYTINGEARRKTGYFILKF